MTDLTTNKAFYNDIPYDLGYDSRQKALDSIATPLRNFAEQHARGLILDLGCGCGRDMYYLYQYDKLIGVDQSQSSIILAKQRVSQDNITFMLGDMLNLPFEDSMADTVICSGVVHHTGDAKKGVEECMRVLKPGGHLYLAIYKKWWHYPLFYFIPGSIMRYMMRFRIGKRVVESLIFPYVSIRHLFRPKHGDMDKGKNIFYHYFLSPIVTFHSKGEICRWIEEGGCQLEAYHPTGGTCHMFYVTKPTPLSP